MDVRRATEFFASYRAAFERGSVADIIEHFAFPCHIAGDASTVTLTLIASREEGLRMVEHILAMFRTIGVASVSVLDLTAHDVSPHLVQALVHWALDDEAGTRLYAFEAAYMLAEIDGEMRITAIAHNEVPRYRVCLARLNARSSDLQPS